MKYHVNKCCVFSEIKKPCWKFSIHKIVDWVEVDFRHFQGSALTFIIIIVLHVAYANSSPLQKLSKELEKCKNRQLLTRRHNI